LLVAERPERQGRHCRGPIWPAVSAFTGATVLAVVALQLLFATPQTRPAAAPAAAAFNASPLPTPLVAGAAKPSSARVARRPSSLGDVPVRILIPAIGVDAPVVRLGRNPDGTLQVPEDFWSAGWWQGGAVPGSPGPAVVVAHVDSYRGPALFYDLRRLRRGSQVVVLLNDGARVVFTVSLTQSYAKSAFPTATVYGASARPTLRLITCSGSFDWKTRHYRQNLVVYANDS